MKAIQDARPKMNNLRTVQELYDAFGRKDDARLRQLLAADVEWIQCAGFPGGARRHGVEEVLETVFAGLHGEWRDWRVEIDEYLDAGASIVALGRYAGTHGQTGRSMEAIEFPAHGDIVEVATASVAVIWVGRDPSIDPRN